MEHGKANDGDTVRTCVYCGRPLVPSGTVGFGGSFSITLYEECPCAERATALKEERAREAAEAKSAMLRKMRASGIPKKYLDVEVATNASVRYLEEFERANGKGLYIYGGVGTGKTRESSALAAAFAWAGYSVSFTTSLNMLDQIRKSYSDGSFHGVSHYSDVDVLILDDIGKENANSWAMTTLFQVVNERYESMRPMIITSQYSLPNLQARLSRGGERESSAAIVSRIHELCAPVFLGTVDRRRTADAES